ncbi:MAG TPA: Hsp70 family protein, partial [Pseudomonadales bacterium]
YTTPVYDCIAQGGPAERKFRRLKELIAQNLSYLVFQAIKDFKAELSAAPEAVLDIPELDVDIRLTRGDFEALIADQLAQVDQALGDTLSSAGLMEQDIDIVLCTGGSSLIPAVQRILDDHFPGRVVEHDPFTSVAAGLAIASYRGW